MQISKRLTERIEKNQLLKESTAAANVCSKYVHSHWRRKDFFQGGATSGLLQKFF